ncbi:MAG: serine acetyltransferase [Candidatus Omnitrophica bacterium]|nr:serine acetyltransferase [Candidatus Omnitrophota bacterium]
MLTNLKADIARYIKNPKDKANIYVFFEQGLWAIMVYRFGRWVRTVRLPIVSLLLKLIAFLLFKFIEIITGVSIPASARIGKGFYVGHFGPVILHSDVVIGENFSIGPGVVVGTRGLQNKGVPHIGHNVYIGVGAKVLGDIKIGNNVKVGANSVVLDNVADGVTVVGIPARMIKTRGQR